MTFLTLQSQYKVAYDIIEVALIFFPSLISLTVSLRINITLIFLYMSVMWFCAVLCDDIVFALFRIPQAAILSHEASLALKPN